MKTEFWRMGATPVPLCDIARIVRGFEEDGWDGLAIGEANGVLPDPYAVLAVCAGATTTLRLGTAVSVPLRSALLAADAMATLQTITGGRSRFCMGRGGGGPKIVPKWPVPTSEFETYLEQLQGLLRREGATFTGRTITLKYLDDLDPSLRIPPPPLDVAITGPRTLEIAARFADGLNFSVGANIESLKVAVRRGREAWRVAQRDPDLLSLGCFVQVALTSPGDDGARDAIQGLVMTHSHFSNPRPTPLTAEPLSPSVRAEGPGVKSADADPGAKTPDIKGTGVVQFYGRDAGVENLIDSFAISGDAQYCCDRLNDIVALGFQRIYIGTRGVGIDLDEVNTRRIGRDVLSLLR